jgi:hypothetical protein
VATCAERGIDRLAATPPGSCSMLGQSTIKASPSEDSPSSGAWADSGSLVAVFPATSVAAVRVFAVIAASVAGAAALPAAFSPHQRSVAPTAGGPVPVSAGVSAVPVPASQIAFPAVAGTSGPPSGCLYSERWVLQQAEGRLDGLGCWVEQRCSLDAELPHCRAADFHHDWLEEYKVPLPLWLVRRRGR